MFGIIILSIFVIFASIFFFFGKKLGYKCEEPLLSFLLDHIKLGAQNLGMLIRILPGLGVGSDNRANNIVKCHIHLSSIGAFSIIVVYVSNYLMFK